MPVSSPRSSGCRATAWIIEPKILPMPMPAPTAPRPTPTPKAIALPRSARPVSVVCASKRSKRASLMCGFDGAADVDGGEQGEYERLDGDDDDDLEEVNGDRGRNRHERCPAGDDEDQPDHYEDQH